MCCFVSDLSLNYSDVTVMASRSKSTSQVTVEGTTDHMTKRSANEDGSEASQSDNSRIQTDDKLDSNNCSMQLDNRVSRRKVEKPRRRKRDRRAIDEQDNSGLCETTLTPSDDKVTAGPSNTTSTATNSQSSLPNAAAGKQISASSVKRSQHAASREYSISNAQAAISPATSTPSLNRTPSTTSSAASTPNMSPQDRHGCTEPAKKNTQEFLVPHFGYPKRNDCFVGEGTNSSVRDLEEVMNRHLPLATNDMFRKNYVTSDAGDMFRKTYVTSGDCHTKLRSPATLSSPDNELQPPLIQSVHGGNREPASLSHNNRESVICTNIYSSHISSVKDAHAMLTPSMRLDSAACYRSEIHQQLHRQYKNSPNQSYIYTPTTPSATHMADEVTTPTSLSLTPVPLDIGGMEHQLRWRYSERPLAMCLHNGWSLPTGLADAGAFLSPAYYSFCNSNYTPLSSSSLTYDDNVKNVW